MRASSKTAQSNHQRTWWCRKPLMYSRSKSRTRRPVGEKPAIQCGSALIWTGKDGRNWNRGAKDSKRIDFLWGCRINRQSELDGRRYRHVVINHHRSFLLPLLLHRRLQEQYLSSWNMSRRRWPSLSLGPRIYNRSHQSRAKISSCRVYMGPSQPTRKIQMC